MNFLSTDGLKYFYLEVKKKFEAMLENKVDKEENKKLSTEDFSTEEKTKLQNIQSNAEQNIIDLIKVKDRSGTTSLVVNSTDKSSTIDVSGYATSEDLTKYATTDHVHLYAGSTSSGGSAKSAVILDNARSFKIGDTSHTFNGSENVSWTHAELGVIPHQNIETNVDLDTLKETKFYHIRTTSCVHQPILSEGTLYSDFNVSTPYQLFIIANDSTKAYKRSYSGSTWDAWIELKFTDTSTAAMPQNSKNDNGFVLKGSGYPNKVWKTDDTGNPGWRDDLSGVTGNFLPLTGGTISGDLTVTGGIEGSLLGNASTSTALTSNAGSNTQPVYFSNGKPVTTSYSLATSVPSGAKFTDTVYTHPNSGASAGTYKSVTVNAQGHVTGGSNPTTLAGYGITDAASSSHTHNYLPTSGGTVTGNLRVNSYICGEDVSATGRNHALLMGHGSQDYWNFYEYGGLFRFYKSVSAVDTLLGSITTNGWEGNVKGNVTGNVTGNASTATALTTTNVGSASQPVYFSNGKPVACTSTVTSLTTSEITSIIV